jgi:hypothetical protein
MSKDNVIMPDVSFELGTGDLSIDDIMSQNTNITGESNDNDSFYSEQGYDDYNNYDENEYPVDSNQIEEVDDREALEYQIQEEVNSASYNPEYEESYVENESGEREYNPDIYNAALQILREQNILNIPDELTELDENTLNELLEYDQELRNQQALEYIKSQASDPRLAELIDYTLAGGTYEDALTMKEIVDEQYDYLEMDTQSEYGQRMLIEMYLREGLNPDNPVDQRRLQRLDTEIDSYIMNDEGEELASEAKDYFLEKLEYMKEVEFQKAQEREMEMQNYQRQKLQQEQFWIDNFKNSLEEKPWSPQKKKEIVSQFDIVQLDNGAEMELWKYKWNKIWEHPDLTQVFMDFISDLDPYSLQFNNRNTPVQKQVTNKILEIVNNKKTVSNKFKSEGRSFNRQTESLDQKRAINPASDW